MDVEGEILGLPPDQFARWIAYFKVKRKEAEKHQAKARSKQGAKAGGKFRGR